MSIGAVSDEEEAAPLPSPLEARTILEIVDLRDQLEKARILTCEQRVRVKRLERENRELRGIGPTARGGANHASPAGSCPRCVSYEAEVVLLRGELASQESLEAKIRLNAAGIAANRSLITNPRDEATLPPPAPSGRGEAGELAVFGGDLLATLEEARRALRAKTVECEALQTEMVGGWKQSTHGLQEREASPLEASRAGFQLQERNAKLEEQVVKLAGYAKALLRRIERGPVEISSEVPGERHASGEGEGEGEGDGAYHDATLWHDGLPPVPSGLDATLRGAHRSPPSKYQLVAQAGGGSPKRGSPPARRRMKRH